MMWAVMGIGMLINTIQGAKMRGQASRRGAALSQQMNQLKAEIDRTGKSLSGSKDNFKPRSLSRGPSFSIHVDYPDEAYKNLNKMQNKHLGERKKLTGTMRKDLSQMKDDFFKNNHYDTELGAKGEGTVRKGPDGKPRVKVGAESPQHAKARQLFESGQRLKLTNKHNVQMEQLTKQEAGKARRFLSDNASLLGDAGVQQELQKMIVSGKKKALKLQQDQEEERWRTDMPPSKEIQEAVGVGLQEVRQMESRHVAAEENSPDHQILLDFEQQFAAQMADERARAAAMKDEKQFLMDPRKMMQRAKSGPPKKRFDEVLPGYLTASLLQLGIYEA